MILVVEDSELVARTMELLLTKSGYQVRVVNDGATALALLEGDCQPQLVLLDLLLPIMDGNELLQHLLTKEQRPPVIVFSAHLDQLNRELYSVVAATIEKPFSGNSLLELVRRWVEPNLLPSKY